ncbi:Pepsin-3 [Clonorchis sinensis]|uniref:Pepsin-3 n=1 Tax=Clonorchis sinensis TaxID=79923 RepID=A0A419PXQ9_CLOSI|nr:Pepsin-3 [Clonorchis sinensis]
MFKTYAMDEISIISRIEYGEKVLCHPCRVIVDTGSASSFGPRKSLKKVLASDGLQDIGHGVLYALPENVHRVQPIKITMRSRTFILNGEELVRFWSEKYIFALIIDLDPETKDWIFGISLLRFFHTIFDQQNSQVGFAERQC